MKYKVMYRCRHCGVVYGDKEIDQKQALSTMSNPTVGALVKAIGVPPVYVTHLCGGGAMGLAEFIGMKEVTT